MKSQTFTTTIKPPTMVKNFYDPNVTEDIKLEQIMTDDGWVVSSAQSGYFEKVQLRGTDEDYLYYVAQNQAGDLHLFRNPIWPKGLRSSRGGFVPFSLLEGLIILAVVAVLILSALRANAQVTDQIWLDEGFHLPSDSLYHFDVDEGFHLPSDSLYHFDVDEMVVDLDDDGRSYLPVIWKAGPGVTLTEDENMITISVLDLREYVLARVRSDIELFGFTAQELGVERADSCQTNIKWLTENQAGFEVIWQSTRKWRGHYTTKLKPITTKTRTNQARDPIIISTEKVLPVGMRMFLGFDRSGGYESTP